MSTLEQKALEYHRAGGAGKIATAVTKSVATQDDLALAYSPGVAVPCVEIQRDPALAYEYTAKGNLVAVITNGTAVLGLGNIGALAGKPVMEGKVVLFKKFAGIDSFDIEIDETDPDKLVEIIASLHPTFGGINLEDIKAPECFYIERKLRERLSIPVFHDDQHGTAIVVGSGLLNAVEMTGRDIAEIKIVCSGAGAAAIACLELILSLGARRENIFVCDSKGVLTTARELDGEKKAWARDTVATRLSEVIEGADVFLGLSGPGLLSQADVKKMGKQPIIFALANPEPELRPELVREVAPDAIIATGRSDYPNQINNALCFPYLFRAALDSGATTINQEMKIACVTALAGMARSDARFGKDYVVPGLLDPRLLSGVTPKIAQAAFRSGVARKDLDVEEYAARLVKLAETLI
ncbi:malic enzyme-like NAD(P)-binding protein [Pseudoduganella namucuonensis]|uniref:Malate dehydrogenase (Oxaloacetate-decarboxylating)(NADP+) n=1 Tax=Pseudoduganella namucuonensis TaxID=1035707 RepID=A0A1I7LWK2_9BURK|nr:malic enzyme-like NAD(P)-binding protein [Pseudoduganella namucuonensis]SFV14062.1 malate dehydrogenase (oxaloacetate-decarboxylating)(NADP+) [Pseudoduganella namucuonensis]